MIPAVSRALEDLESWKVRLTLENESIRVVYRCRPSAHAAVLSAIAILREHKQEAITLLTEKARGGSRGPQNWPAESLDARKRFGCLEARLYPFIGRQVRTPLGLGKLLQVFKTSVMVILDIEATTPEKDQKVRLFDPTDICPPEVM